MYNEFYGFRRDPFNVTPDSDFIYYSDQHKETLASMLYGIQERQGLILVTGRVGSGKTTLCRALLGELGEDTRVALLFNPRMNPSELLEAVCRDLDCSPDEGADVSDLRQLLRSRARRLREQGGNLCVIVDESQNCSVEALKALLELSRPDGNGDGDRDHPIQLILVGQPELENRLNHPQLREFKQHVSIRTHLTNMAEEDVAGYVQHRIDRAEPDEPVKFESSVYPALYAASGGNPRALNLLCDRSLMAAYVEDATTVTLGHLERAKEDLAEHTRSKTEVDPRILYQLESSDTTNRPSWWRRFRSNPAALGVSVGIVVLAVVFLLTRWLSPGAPPPPDEAPSRSSSLQAEVRLYSQPQADTGPRGASGGGTETGSTIQDTGAPTGASAPPDTESNQK